MPKFQEMTRSLNNLVGLFSTPELAYYTNAILPYSYFIRIPSHFSPTAGQLPLELDPLPS